MSYPELALLLQGYLNIDWPDDYEDPMAAVDDYVANEPNSAELAAEIESLLTNEPSNDGLTRVVMDRLGSGYPPEADGWTMAAWLRAVADRVRSRPASA